MEKLYKIELKWISAFLNDYIINATNLLKKESHLNSNIELALIKMNIENYELLLEKLQRIINSNYKRVEIK